MSHHTAKSAFASHCARPALASLCEARPGCSYSTLHQRATSGAALRKLRGKVHSTRRRAAMHTMCSEDGERSDRRRSQPPEKIYLDAGPTTPKPTYDESPLDRLALWYFNRTLAEEAGEEFREGMEGTGLLARSLSQKFGSARATQRAASRVLARLVPPRFLAVFRRFLTLFPDWFVARHAAAATPLVVPWLVGPSRVADCPTDLLPDCADDVPPSVIADIAGAAKQPAGYRQAAVVERCRVLEETGCASVCINVCKIPTQKFFQEELGLPLQMHPNFETYECTFCYGRSPPAAIEEDPVADTPCFMQCPSKRPHRMVAEQCHQLELDGKGGEQPLQSDSGAGQDE